MREILVSEKAADQRIDKFIRKYLSEAPLSFIYHLFRKKDIRLNDHPAKIDMIIRKGDVIRLYLSEERLSELMKRTPLIKKAPFPYPIAYEDENVLIVSKPRGVLVHGAGQKTTWTLLNAVVSYLYLKGEYDPKEKGFVPAPVHRLDRNTSGLVIFAKNLPAEQALADLLKSRTGLSKVYLALVLGNVRKRLVIDAPLKKDARRGLVQVDIIDPKASPAVSIITPKENLPGFALIEAELVTGRTHQLRVHLAHVGHPIIGDAKYGDFATNRLFRERYGFKNQFLHATRLRFGELKGVLVGLSNKVITVPLAAPEQAILQDLRGFRSAG